MIASIWEPLTAIGTLTMAAFTLTLALATIKLVAKGSDEVRAQWRPVLVIEPMQSNLGSRPALSIAGGALSLTVRNVGRGPALGVTATLDFDRLYLAEPVGVIVAPDDYGVLSWSGLGEHLAKTAFVGWINYGDVSYASYTTRFDAKLEPEGSLRLIQFHSADEPFLRWWQERLPRRAKRMLVKRRLARFDRTARR